MKKKKSVSFYLNIAAIGFCVISLIFGLFSFVRYDQDFGSYTKIEDHSLYELAFTDPLIVIALLTVIFSFCALLLFVYSLLCCKKGGIVGLFAILSGEVAGGFVITSGILCFFMVIGYCDPHGLTDNVLELGWAAWFDAFAFMLSGILGIVAPLIPEVKAEEGESK